MSESGLERGLGLAGATATNMLGMIGVGPFLTLPAMLNDIQITSQAQILLLDTNGRLLGSTIANVKGDLIDEHLRSYLALASPGRAATRSMTIAGQEYEFQFTNFYLRQHVEGYLAVALSRRSVVEAGLQSAFQMTVLFAGVVLILLLSRRRV